MGTTKMPLASVSVLVAFILGSATSFDLRGASQAVSSGFSEGEPSHVKQTRSVDMALTQPIQVCGLRLLEAVRVICRNRGGYLMTRRSDPSLSLGKQGFYKKSTFNSFMN
jgi:hypothetical protein